MQYVGEGLTIAGALVAGAGLAFLLKNVAAYHAEKNAAGYLHEQHGHSFVSDYAQEAKKELSRTRNHLWGFGTNVGEWLWYRNYLRRVEAEPSS